MDNKVYYGEYSLKHWIDLMLKGNIMLPWYQRSFVWEKGQIEKLIETLDNNQFIPPVIIGAVRKEGEWKNYILDGQQRLTSILFAKHNTYIDKKEYAFKKPEAKIEQIADDVMDNEDDEEVKMIQWDFNKIIKDKKIDSEELKSSFYKKLLTQNKDDKFFNEHYLGFAYIKPSNNVKEEEQSKFYSDIFRNINTGGTKLTRLENRKALYFLKEYLTDFFAPTFLNNIKVETSSKESGLIDFVKYLSILSQWKGNNNLLKYGGRSWEKNEEYYKKYIMAIVNNETKNELLFDISYPSTVAPKGSITETHFSQYDDYRIQKLKTTIDQLSIPKSFESIIDMDMFFFGLVNEIIFNDKEIIDSARKDELHKKLKEKIEELKNTDNHKNNPNALRYLKSRIAASIDIYTDI